MIRRLAVLLSLATVLATPSLTQAATVTLNDYSGGISAFETNAAGGGAPFTATTGLLDGGPLGNNVSFITFCIEFNEHFSYGGTYDYTLSDEAINGGVSGGNPDPVDNATRWLYYQVATGGYTSFSTYFGTASDNIGARVQEAIWNIEGERQDGEISAESKALAEFAKTQNWGAIADQGYAVLAMNLTSAAGLAQDQLAMTFTPTDRDIDPVPEPATLVLLGTGLLATARRFNRRKAQ